MKNVILEKKNGVVTITNSTKDLENKIKAKRHLCWQDCDNACPSRCNKIYDLEKKDIDAYDFITDGYQVKKDGNVSTFIVSKCKNYENTNNNVSTISWHEAKELRDNLRKLYYGVEDIEEAWVIQGELVDRGVLGDIRGKRVSQKQLIKMRRKVR